MRSRGCRRRWSGRLQVPPVRTRCAGADCPWLQARGSPGVGSSSVQWLGAQVPGLAGEEALIIIQKPLLLALNVFNLNDRHFIFEFGKNKIKIL